MQNKTWRAIGAGAVLLGLAFAAMAQGGSGDPSATEISAPFEHERSSSEPAHTGESTSLAAEPFDYRVGLLAGVSTTNFWRYIGEEPTVWNAYVLGPTKPALYGIEPHANSLVPDLAADEPADPTWDETGWRVRIDLGDDLAWSDGRPVTAADMAYTFHTVRRLALGGGWADAYPAEIEDIVAETPDRLRIEFTRRPSLQVWPYGIGLAPIMAAHAWEPATRTLEAAGSLFALPATSDVSGGPLEVESVDENRIVSVANPGYAGPTPDTVTYIVYPDEAGAVAGLRDGEVDTVLSPNGLSPTSVNMLEAEAEVTIERSPANSVRYVGFNLGREPMSDSAFRQAVALLLDRESAKQSLVPDADAAYTLLTAANKTWFDGEQASQIAAMYAGDLADRLAKVVSSLEEVGYRWSSPPSLVGDGFVAGSGLTIDSKPPAPLTILTPGDEYDPARSDYTQRIEATVELLGFDARPVVTDFDTVVDLAFTADEAGVRQYDMYVLGWTLGNPALPDYYGWLFASNGAANSTGYSNPEFDSNLARYEKATETDSARNALWDMERQLAVDLPYLVLYHPDIVEAYRSNRISFRGQGALGGIQGRLGGIIDLTPVS